jgi:hypothetical protein
MNKSWRRECTQIFLCTGLPLWIQSPIAQDADTPPSIVVQPRDQSASLGAEVSFRVTPSSSSSTLFQWQRNQTELSGATNAMLVLTNVQLAQAGDHAVVLFNNLGAVTSRVATLTIDPAFTKITAGPIVNDRGDSTGVAWVDYDGDGGLERNSHQM